VIISFPDTFVVKGLFILHMRYLLVWLLLDGTLSEMINTRKMCTEAV
jgi:hypothetical protein